MKGFSQRRSHRCRGRRRNAASALAAAILCTLGAISPADAAQVDYAVAGVSSAVIDTAFKAFKAELGTDNASQPSQPTGYRALTWDDVPDGNAAPNALPGDYYNVTSTRGIVLAGGPGVTSLQVSATAGSGTPVRFGHVNPTYTGTFGVNSAERLFSPIGSNVVDVTFRVPGTNARAFVKAFGAVFLDVDEFDRARGRG